MLIKCSHGAFLHCAITRFRGNSRTLCADAPGQFRSSRVVDKEGAVRNPTTHASHDGTRRDHAAGMPSNK